MARRELSNRVSWSDSFGMLTYTVDALGLGTEDGDKEVGGLARKGETVIAAWESLDVEQRRARRAVARAHAMVRRRDFQADAFVKVVANDALHIAAQNRAHPLYVRLFPEPMSTIVRMALEAELPELRRMARVLEEPETPAELRKKHGASLAQVIERGTAAIEAREEAFATAGRIAARVASWRETANNVLLGIDGALKGLAAERKLDDEWVDSFFPEPAKSSSRTSKDPAAPSTTPAA